MSQNTTKTIITKSEKKSNKTIKKQIFSNTTTKKKVQTEIVTKSERVVEDYKYGVKKFDIEYEIIVHEDGTDCLTVYDDLGYTYIAAGENIAKGWSSVESV